MTEAVFSHQVRREQRLPMAMPPSEPHTRLFHRQTGSGNGEVARIDPDGTVHILQPAYLDHLCQRDMISLLKAIAPGFVDQGKNESR